MMENNPVDLMVILLNLNFHIPMGDREHPMKSEEPMGLLWHYVRRTPYVQPTGPYRLSQHHTILDSCGPPPYHSNCRMMMMMFSYVGAPFLYNPIG
jgi:hypothetical protein